MGECELGGGDGGPIDEGHWSLEGDFAGPTTRHHLRLSGRAGGTFFEARQVSGPIEELRDGGQKASDSVLGKGTFRAMTFYRYRTEPGFAPRQLDAVAAISVWKPDALYLARELDAALRVDVMLAAGALVALRSVTALP